jgi:iron complex transport system substrate-binding protein
MQFMRVVYRAVLCSVLALVPAAFASVTVTDDLGHALTLPRVPERIVSLSTGATEMLYGVGAGDRLIATVEYSDEPPAAQRLPRIGDAASIDVERLIALHADVVVVWPRGNNPAQLAAIERLGLPIYREQVDTFRDFPASMRRLGMLAGTSATADQAARVFEGQLAALAARHADRRPVSVLLQIWDHPIYTVGGKHLMSDALRLCGARNVFAELEAAAPVVDIEAVIARDPDLIIAAAPPGAAAGWLARWRAFPALNAVRLRKLIAFEDQRLTRLGPSALAATDHLCRVIDAARAR